MTPSSKYYLIADRAAERREDVSDDGVGGQSSGGIGPSRVAASEQGRSSGCNLVETEVRFAGVRSLPMVSLDVYFRHGLRDLLDAMTRSRWNTQAGALRLFRLRLRYRGKGERALARFHRRRWRPPASAGTPSARSADLAELLGGLHLLSVGLYEANEVFIRSLSTPSRRASQAGIDGTAFRIRGLTTEPLQRGERLHFIEAKHTAKDRPATPLDALRDDLAKTDDQRVRDELQLVVSYLETVGTYAYPERVNQFLAKRRWFVLTALIDPTTCDEESTRMGAMRRFTGATAACGIPVRRFVLSSVPDLYAWIARTL